MRAVAIVNAHARRLRGRLASRLERALPGGVRLTHSLDEARAVLREDVRRGVDLVAFAGGDGTIVMGLALLAEACRGAGKSEPCVGVLRLGSGNAIADAVGASKDPAADLAQLAAGRGTWRAIPLIETLGVRAPFVGVGVDAQLLEDHAVVGRALDRVPGVRRLGPGSRYVLSVGMRSIPRFALNERPLATVTNLGSPAAELGPRGGSVRPTGAPLWSGACTLVAGATMPYFGFGLEMFAFASSLSGRFQLRCGDPGLPEIVRNLPNTWRGKYFSDRVRDFACDRVRIELSEPVAVEAGGELLGRERVVELQLAAPARFASLRV